MTPSGWRSVPKSRMHRCHYALIITRGGLHFATCVVGFDTYALKPVICLANEHNLLSHLLQGLWQRSQPPTFVGPTCHLPLTRGRSRGFNLRRFTCLGDQPSTVYRANLPFTKCVALVSTSSLSLVWAPTSHHLRRE